MSTYKGFQFRVKLNTINQFHEKFSCEKRLQYNTIVYSYFHFYIS